MPMRSAPSQHVNAVCNSCEGVTHHIRTTTYTHWISSDGKFGEGLVQDNLVCLRCKCTTKRKTYHPWEGKERSVA